MMVYRSTNKPLILAGIISGVLVIYLLSHGGGPPSSSITWTATAQGALLPTGVEAPGELVHLADLKGQRIGLVFVTPTCPYCNRLEEQLEAFSLPQDRYLLVVCKGGKVDAQKIEKAHALRFSILVDSTGEAHQTYHVSSVPLVYLVDEAGMVEASARGVTDIWEAIRKLE